MKDIRTFFSMLGAVIKGRYPMPWRTVLLGIFFLIYAIWPLDLIPDILPLIGIADDGALLVLLLTSLNRDLSAYRDSLSAPQDKVIDLGDIKDHKK